MNLNQIKQWTEEECQEWFRKGYGIGPRGGLYKLTKRQIAKLKKLGAVVTENDV